MVKYLTEPQQRELLKAARTQAGVLAQRDYHWMAALILTGMRIAEFAHLRTAQVKQGLATGWLVSRREHCKGKRKTNEYFVTMQLKLHLQHLVALSELESTSDDQPLVWGRSLNGVAGPLSVRSYEARMKVWTTAAVLDPRLSPHALRHTRGMNVMTRTRGSNGVLVAQRALNHTSLRSTGIYLQMRREDYEREVAVVDGGGRMRKVEAQRLAAQGAVS